MAYLHGNKHPNSYEYAANKEARSFNNNKFITQSKKATIQRKKRGREKERDFSSRNA